jgi:4,5-dihydroxyphthalate decarboxylase
MLVSHEIDAAPISGHLSRAVNVIDRSTHMRGSEGDWSKVKPLFPDSLTEARRFFLKYGFVPVNHTYIIRGDVYRDNPWVAFNLYAAFVKAKTYAREKLLERIPAALFFGREYLAMTQETLGDDPFPYGLKTNQAMLETITSFSHEQGLTPRKMKPEELFAESTRDL